MDDLDGRQVVVVGALGALGAAVCDAFVAAGAQVHGLDRVEPEQPQQSVQHAVVDVLSDASLDQWFATAPVQWAVVNVVGGFAPEAKLADLDDAELTQQLRLNLVSAALLTKHALRRMVEAGQGRVVHTASRSALQPQGSGFAYSVSKLGVLHLVEMAAREVRDTAITVNAVVPSVLDTPANRAAMPNADHDRWPRLTDVAAVYRFLASPAAQLISGAAVPVYGRT